MLFSAGIRTWGWSLANFVFVCSHTDRMNLLLIENQKKLLKNNKELGKGKKKRERERNTDFAHKIQL